MRLIRPLPVLIALSLVACGGSGPPAEAAAGAHKKGDYAAAVDHYDQALAAAAADSPEHAELTIDRLRSLIHVDAKKAASELTALIGAEGSELQVRDINLLMTDFWGAQKFVEAVTVLDASMKKYEGNEALIKLKDKLIAEAKKDPEGEGFAALKGMGYL